MRVSAKTEYATLAILELAVRHTSDEPIRLRTIADAHGIPQTFLVQILLQLKAAGLVNSTRGASGGYQLLKPPGEITLGEVMSVMEGSEGTSRPATHESPTTRALWKTFRQIEATERELLEGVTFADLAERVRGEASGMYYI